MARSIEASRFHEAYGIRLLQGNLLNMKEAVLIIGFNRKQKMQRMVQEVVDYHPRQTYVFCDGPRQYVPGEVEKCADVRDYVKSVFADSAQYLFPESNLGCRGGPPSAISWFLSHEERGIILEDDVVPSANFFKFCEYYLARCEKDSRIALVSGFNPLGKLAREDVDGVTKFPQIWGWATWRRVWNGYTNALTVKAIRKESRRLRKWINRDAHFQYWRECFRKIAVDNLNTWDYQLVFHVMKQRGLGIVPAINLIENVGFDHEATHTVNGSYTFPLLLGELNMEDRKVDLDSHPSIDDRIARDHYHIQTFRRHFYRKRLTGLMKSIAVIIIHNIKRALGIQRIKFWEAK